MDFLYIIFIAFALGIDAFSVALGAGAFLEKTTSRQKFRLSFHFGFFQFIMPIIGWLVGSYIETYVSEWDHWIVLIILSVIGVKMICDSIKKDSSGISKDVTKGAVLIVLSIATSIDALAIGFGIALIQGDILMPAIIIGIVAAIMTLVGILIGEKISARIGKKAGIIGGVILILIGLKVVIEHLNQ